MTERIRFQYKTYDNDEWKDVVNSYGDFVLPSWEEGFQYRRKPKPDTEVVNPKWPETTLTAEELDDIYGDAPGYSYVPIANAAIAHALEIGLVALPSGIPDTSERDMKLACAVWDAAIRAVATHPEFYYSLNFPDMLKGVISTVK